MSEFNKKYQVFISSVFEGFREERSIATQSILRSNNIPVGMEQFPNGPDQWKYITALIDECDIFIVIIGSRYGSLAKRNKGYVEIEYEYAKKRGLRPLVFYSANALENSLKNSHPSEHLALTKFIERVKKESGITMSYTSIPELGSQIYQALGTESKRLHPTDTGWIQVTGGVLTQLDKQKINQEVSSIVNPVLNVLSEQFFNPNVQDKSMFKSVADNFYQVFCDMINLESSPVFIDIGYWLTDIYERTNDFAKSANIANDIIKIIETQYQKDGTIKNEHIRKLIGCAYSMILFKEEDYARKLKLLSDAKPILIQAKGFLERQHMDNKIGNNDYLELKGLLNSDLGALSTNYYDNDHNHKVISEQEYLAESLAYHKEALEARKKWLANLSTASSDKTNPIQTAIAQSTSNIGGVYYRLGDYNRALKDQNSALDVFTKVGEKTRVYATKGYIIGIYLMLWDKDPSRPASKDYKVCCEYASELATAFFTRHEQKKAKEIYDDKIVPLRNLTSNPSLNNIFIDVFSRISFSLDWFNI